MSGVCVFGCSGLSGSGPTPGPRPNGLMSKDFRVTRFGYQEADGYASGQREGAGQSMPERRILDSELGSLKNYKGDAGRDLSGGNPKRNPNPKP